MFEPRLRIFVWRYSLLFLLLIPILGVDNDAVESDPEDENESELNLEVEIQDTRHLAEFDQSNAK